MENFDKYYDSFERRSELKKNSEEMENLISQLGDLDQYEVLESRINESMSEEFAPSDSVKAKLDEAFEQKHSDNFTKRSGIISLQAFQKSSPYKLMATAASMTIILFLSVQMGFNNFHGEEEGAAFFADSISTNAVVDSGQVQIDSAFIHWQ